MPATPGVVAGKDVASPGIAGRIPRQIHRAGGLQPGVGGIGDSFGGDWRPMSALPAPGERRPIWFRARGIRPWSAPGLPSFSIMFVA